MNTPLTDSLLTKLETESKCSGTAIDSKFDVLAEFARTLEAKANGSNLTNLLRVGSVLRQRAGGSGTVSDIDEIAMTISITNNQNGEIRSFGYLKFIEILEFQRENQGMQIEF